MQKSWQSSIVDWEMWLPDKTNCFTLIFYNDESKGDTLILLSNWLNVVIWYFNKTYRGNFSGGSHGEENCLPCRRQRPGFEPWVRKIPWSWKWQPTPVFFPEEFHGQRNLAGYCPWGRKELDTTGHSTAVYTGWTQAGNSPESQKHPMQSGYMSMYFLSCYGKVLVAQSCSTLCDPTDCRPKGSSVHEILQARILEWVATPFSRASSQPRDWTRVSCIAGISFTIWAAKEAVSKMILKDLGENPSHFKK